MTIIAAQTPAELDFFEPAATVGLPTARLMPSKPAVEPGRGMDSKGSPVEVLVEEELAVDVLEKELKVDAGVLRALLTLPVDPALVTLGAAGDVVSGSADEVVEEETVGTSDEADEEVDEVDENEEEEEEADDEVVNGSTELDGVLLVESAGEHIHSHSLGQQLPATSHTVVSSSTQISPGVSVVGGRHRATGHPAEATEHGDPTGIANAGSATHLSSRHPSSSIACVIPRALQSSRGAMAGQHTSGWSAIGTYDANDTHSSPGAQRCPVQTVVPGYPIRHAPPTATAGRHSAVGAESPWPGPAKPIFGPGPESMQTWQYSSAPQRVGSTEQSDGREGSRTHAEVGQPSAISCTVPGAHGVLSTSGQHTCGWSATGTYEAYGWHTAPSAHTSAASPVQTSSSGLGNPGVHGDPAGTRGLHEGAGAG